MREFAYNLIVVGECPMADGNTDPVSGVSARRLAEFLGIEWSVFLAQVERRNVLEHHVPTFPIVMAKARARDLAKWFGMKSCLVTRLRVVLLGRRVAKAFGQEAIGFMSWCRISGVQATVVPHPAATNRYWRAEGTEAVRRFLHKLTRPVA